MVGVFLLPLPTAHIPEDGGDENLMRVLLDYGRSGIAVDVPDDRLVGPLAVREVSPLEDPSAAIATAIERPIGAPPLRKLATGRHDACIVGCDITLNEIAQAIQRGRESWQRIRHDP